MARKNQSPVPAGAIAANLHVMAELVGLTVEAIGEAQALFANGKQAAAIKALSGADVQLDEALMLHRAILTVHRHR